MREKLQRTRQSVRIMKEGVAVNPGHALSSLIDGRALTAGQHKNAFAFRGFRPAMKKAIIRLGWGESFSAAFPDFVIAG